MLTGGACGGDDDAMEPEDGGAGADQEPDAEEPEPDAPAAGEWIKVEPEGALCGNGSQYKFFVNYSETSDDLVIAFEPGGACWDYDSCTGKKGVRGAANPDGIPDDHMDADGRHRAAVPAPGRGQPDEGLEPWCSCRTAPATCTPATQASRTRTRAARSRRSSSTTTVTPTCRP